MKKQPLVTAETKKCLIDAFWKLYEKKDIDKIRISEITELAGYHRGTFYEYFSDIYALQEEIENDLLVSVTSRIKKAYAEFNFGADDHLITILSSGYLEFGPALNLIMKRDRHSFIVRLEEFCYPFFLELHGLEDSYNIRIIFEFFVNGVLMTINKWHEDGQIISSEELAATLRLLMVNGPYRTLQDIKANEQKIL